VLIYSLKSHLSKDFPPKFPAQASPFTSLSGVLLMFGFIKNILSSDKSDSTAPKAKKQKGYFLELDDSAISQPSNGSKPAELAKTEPAPEAKAEPAKVEPAKAASEVIVVEPAKVEAAPAETKPAKTKAKKPKPEPTVKPEPAPTPAPVAATKQKTQPEPEKTFAPKYLMSTGSNGRRRPGANMSSFLDMARQVKPSNQ
jgi:outer membrane biosynthesis protein TonB